MAPKFFKLTLVLLSIQSATLSANGQKNTAKADSLAMEVIYSESTLRVNARYFYQQPVNITDSVYFTLNPSFKVDKITSARAMAQRVIRQLQHDESITKL